MSNVKKSVLAHLKELRERLFYALIGLVLASVVGFYFYQEILALLLVPFNSLPNLDQTEFVISTVFEGFVTKIKLSLYAGVTLSSPWLLYQSLAFLLPALSSKEKKGLFVTLVLSTLLIGGGLYFGYLWVLPISLAMLLSDQFVMQGSSLYLNLAHSLFYVLHFLVALCVAFQLPLILGWLLFSNALSLKTCVASTRYVIVGIFLLCALITPPDITSLFALALPLMILFGITLAIAKLFRWGRV